MAADPPMGDEGMVGTPDEGAGGLDLGNYEFADSVANDLRSTAREGAIEDLTESVESGIYSPQSLYTADRFTPDQLIDFAEEGVPAEVEFSHVESLAGSPQVGAESELGVLTDEWDHFFGHHAGNYANDPSEFANPDWETDTLADEWFGEGSNLRVVDGSEDLGLTETDEWWAEGGEVGSEAAEGLEAGELGLGAEEAIGAGEIAAEAAEGIELIDVLEIGAILLL